MGRHFYGWEIAKEIDKSASRKKEQCEDLKKPGEEE